MVNSITITTLVLVVVVLVLVLAKSFFILRSKLQNTSNGFIGSSSNFCTNASSEKKIDRSTIYPKRQLSLHLLGERARITTSSEARESNESQSSVWVALSKWCDK